MTLFVLSSCGGGDAEGDGGGGETSSSGLAAAECQSIGFTGSASRIADDGMSQLAGEYTGGDFVDAVAVGGSWTKIAAASYPLEFGAADATPDVPTGGVAIRIDVADGSTGATGDLGWGNPGFPPLITNAGFGGNQDDTEGTYRVIEATDDAVCVEVIYADSHQAIDGVFVARLGA